MLKFAAALLTFVLLSGCTDSEDSPGPNPTAQTSEDDVGIVAAVTPHEGTVEPLPTTASERLVPTTLMFCEPATQGDGEAVTVATVPGGLRVVYSDGCHPDLSSDGTVLVREEGGGISRILPDHVPLSRLSAAENVVWQPDTGRIADQNVVMTGRYFDTDASVEVDPVGKAFLILNLNDDGNQVFASLSERIISRPLAPFLNNQPLVDSDGRIVAPFVQSRIDETIALQGLSAGDAVFLRDLVNTGNAR